METLISPRGDINDPGDIKMPSGEAEKIPRSFGHILLLSEHYPWEMSPWFVMEDSKGVRGNLNFKYFYITFVHVL